MTDHRDTVRRIAPLGRVKIAHNRLLTRTEKRDWAKAQLLREVEAARKHHTLEEIGQVLGITRQGVFDLLKR